MKILIRIAVTVIVNQTIRSFIIAFLFLFAGLYSNGQSINDLRKLWQNDNLTFLSENQKSKLFTSADFYKYASRRDEEFGDYLKESWQDYSIEAGLKDEYLNCMVEPPVFYDSDLSMSPPVNLPFSKVVGSKFVGSNYKTLIPRIRKPESYIFTSLSGSFRFYGQPVSISYDKLLVLSKVNSVSEDSISGFWQSFSRANSNHLVDQLMDYRDLLGLGDWGYFQLVKATSNHIFTNNTLNADLLTWALMIRSGFDVRFAFNQSSTTVLFPSEHVIYGRSFIVIGQTRFYLDRNMNSPLLITYKNQFPDNIGRIDLTIFKSLNFSGKLVPRKFSYQWNKKNYEFTLRYNPEVIHFYNDYPDTDPAIYFQAPISSALKDDLLRRFYPLLSKMDKAEATAFLQRFVQSKFDYTLENQNSELSGSRFAEEVIGLKSGDDRSKSVLFSWLVRIILKLPVVGVQFPDHFSTAVCINEPLDGDYYYLNRGNYYITDPTFIDAPLGVSMPEYLGLTPKLIDLSCSLPQSGNVSEIWNQALKLGARRGGISQDVVFDQQGRSLITGYFNAGDNYTPFLACFSPEKSLQWMRKFDGDGEAVAFAIRKAGDDEIYVAGSFSGRINMDGIELESGIQSTELFIAQFNQNGKLIWMNKAEIDSTAKEKSLVYMLKFDRSGDNVCIQWSNEDERNVKTGFGDAGLSGLYLTGTTGMIPSAWESYRINISGDIIKEYNELIGKKCHPQVAGIVALIKLLQNQAAEVTGNQIQKVITKFSPSFEINNAALFKMIGHFQSFKNENGIISVRTIGGQPLLFNNLSVEDGARFIVSSFDNGDLSVGIISGFRKIVNQVSLPLNSFLIDISSGNLILDYDNDHTIKTIALGSMLSAK